jgi:hypothetical protein
MGNPSYPSFHDTMHPDYTRRYVRVVVVYDICTIENTPTRSTDVQRHLLAEPLIFEYPNAQAFRVSF